MINEKVDEELFTKNIWFYCKTCLTIPSIQINFYSDKPQLFLKCNCNTEKNFYINKELLNHLKNSLQNNNDNICFFEPNNKNDCLYCLNCDKNYCKNCLEIHNQFLEHKHFLFAL